MFELLLLPSLAAFFSSCIDTTWSERTWGREKKGALMKSWLQQKDKKTRERNRLEPLLYERERKSRLVAQSSRSDGCSRRLWMSSIKYCLWPRRSGGVRLASKESPKHVGFLCSSIQQTADKKLKQHLAEKKKTHRRRDRARCNKITSEVPSAREQQTLNWRFNEDHLKKKKQCFFYWVSSVRHLVISRY